MATPCSVYCCPVCSMHARRRACLPPSPACDPPCPAPPAAVRPALAPSSACRYEPDTTAAIILTGGDEEAEAAAAEVRARHGCAQHACHTAIAPAGRQTGPACAAPAAPAWRRPCPAVRSADCTTVCPPCPCADLSFRSFLLPLVPPPPPHLPGVPRGRDYRGGQAERGGAENRVPQVRQAAGVRGCQQHPAAPYMMID